MTSLLTNGPASSQQRGDAARRVRFELPAQPRARRSHAERTAETRAKIIAAVVVAIAENGFQRTTAQVIALRAGVTWGAVQHHFGGKDGLLLAVLEDTFNRFAQRLADVPLANTTLAERASVFVDRAWAHFRSRHFRSTFEILLNYLGRKENRGADDWRAEMARAWDRVWSRIFADAHLPRRRSLMLQHFTISALSGLAATRILEGGEAALPPQELELLKETLTRALTAAK
jgi:AcrR family transcriptional regulator